MSVTDGNPTARPKNNLEDHLQEELHGYMEYAQDVKYRLLPGVW